MCKFFFPRCSDQKLNQANNKQSREGNFPSLIYDALSNRIWTRCLAVQQLRYITLNLPLLYNYNEVLKQNIAWSVLDVLRKTLKFFCNEKRREKIFLPFSLFIKNYFQASYSNITTIFIHLRISSEFLSLIYNFS